MPAFEFCCRRLSRIAVCLGLAVAASTFAVANTSPAAAASRQVPTPLAKKNASGGWGFVVQGQGMADVSQPFPLQVEVWDKKADQFTTLLGDYRSFKQRKGQWIGQGSIKSTDGVQFDFADRWTVEGTTLRLNRMVIVKGDREGGFRSSVSVELTQAQTWPQAEWFVPGMIYGNFSYLRNNSFGAGNYYRPGAYAVWIREDRMPAPLMSARFADGSTLSVLNPAPDGRTTDAEGNSFSLDPLADARFQFGAVGAQENEKTLQFGYLFPGSEGELSYGKKTAAGPETSHHWRRRYHPIANNFTHTYEVSFRFDQTDSFNDFMAKTWRWAWQTLKPQVNPQPLDAIRHNVVDVLADSTLEIDDRAGTQIVRPAIPGLKESENPKAIMGFIGYALGSAEMMLAESNLDVSGRGQELRRKAEKSIASFLRIPMSPPAGEGFFLKTGGFATSQGGLKTDHELFLRCFTDDMKSLMRAYEDEQRAGRTHPEWLVWIQQFGDWLLAQENPQGGFPRSWMPRTGEIVSASTTGSFMAVPFYAQLHRLTGRADYLAAALRTAEYAWAQGQNVGRFVGGTIDNPDVIDKEAATISLEGYLALHDITKDQRWIDRAQAAAAMAETWMYIWDVPMPADSSDKKLQWKKDIPTTGLQLISTGHSLVDAYMAFDVASFAKLYRLTGDKHYLEVASILLHNTKAMIELPGKPLGLRGPGWQQEHYCFSLPRGVGRHQYWLPWVAISQLRGMKDLITQDPELYKQIATPAPARSTKPSHPR